ncbi:hypothetical protein PC115_g16323, partial [Phytophthora cactorum]
GRARTEEGGESPAGGTAADSAGLKAAGAEAELGPPTEEAPDELRAEQSTSKRKYEPGNDGLRYIESFLMNML